MKCPLRVVSGGANGVGAVKLRFMSYVLHYAPDNASLVVRLALEELGVPYRTVLVDRSRREQDSDQYRSINPVGLIPALEGPDGVVFETGAILLCLADRHGMMAPTAEASDRGAFLTWLFFTSNTLHTGLRSLFYPEKYVGTDSEAQRLLQSTLHRNLAGHLRLLDQQVGAGVIGQSVPTVLDYYIGVCLRWCALYPEGGTSWFHLPDYPSLQSMAAELEQRPAMLSAAVSEGLGPNPLTRPISPNPPEGTAV